MQVTHRIPTSQYAFVEFTEECASPEEAIAQHKHYIKAYEDKAGLDTRQWAQARNNMLNTGELDPNLLEEMSHAQRWFCNELKKALRAGTETDTIHHSMQ